MESGGENARGLHAIRVLQDKKDFTLDTLITAAYDSYLTAFADLIPPLLRAYDQLSDASPLKASVEGSDRDAARLGSAMVGVVGPDLGGRLLG